MQIQGRFLALIGLIAIPLVSLVFTPQQASAAATTLRETAFSLPHFCGDTDAEFARENGREIAKDRLVECEVCQALNQADGLNRDCDLFDDGLSNSSCGSP